MGNDDRRTEGTGNREGCKLKVWVVVEHGNEWDAVLAVFETKALAYEYCKRNADYEAKEFEVQKEPVCAE